MFLARMVMPRSRSSAFGVHHALGRDLAGVERAGLPEQLVDERGLAVVDVGDDRDVAQLRGQGGGHGGARGKVGAEYTGSRPAAA